MRPVISGWGRRTPANTCTSTAPKKTRDPGPTGNTGSLTLSTPKSTSPSYRSSLNERKRLGLADFPAEILCSIAAFSAPTDRIALSQTARHISASIEQERQAALIIIHASLVRTLDEFESLLTRVGGLPHSLQAAPLTALGARIPALRRRDTQSAIQAFLDFLESVNPPSTAELDAVKEAASNGRDGINDTVSNLIHEKLYNGQSVQNIVDQFAMRDPAMISGLEKIAFNGPAKEAVRQGDRVVDVAKQFGLEKPEFIRALENYALDHGSAAMAVRMGKHVAAIADMYGIESPEGKRKLEEISRKATAYKRRWFSPSWTASMKIAQMKQRVKDAFTRS